MDLWCYERILKWRGEAPDCIRVDEPQYTHAQVLFRSDLAKEKIVWTGQFWPDFRFNLKTQHSLLSIFTVPSLHPYSSPMRAIVTASVVSLSAMFYAWNLLTSGIHQWLLMLLEIGVTSILAFVLGALARGAAVQDKGFEERTKMRKWADASLLASFGISCVCGLLAFTAMSLNDFGYFAIAMIGSWLLEVVLQLPVFAVLWTRERKQERSEIESRFYISFLEYDAWKRARNNPAGRIRTDTGQAAKMTVVRKSMLSGGHVRNYNYNKRKSQRMKNAKKRAVTTVLDVLNSFRNSKPAPRADGYLHVSLNTADLASPASDEDPSIELGQPTVADPPLRRYSSGDLI